MKRYKISFLVIVLLVIFAGCSTNQKEEKKHSNLFNVENIRTTEFKINSGNDTILLCPKGTNLQIGKNIFVDSNGKKIIGDIGIEVKEVLAKEEIVLAGLHTRSNNDIIESAGMIYINATTKDQQLYIAKGESIGVSVPADSIVEGMNIYTGKVDSATGLINWINPEEIIEKPGEVSEEESPIMRNTASEDFVASVAPEKPNKYDASDSRIITIAFDDQKMFPELQQYQNVKFRISDKCDYNPDDADRSWYSVDLAKTDIEGVYIVKFKGYDKSGAIERTYEVTPVYEGTDYVTALADYKKKYQQYEDKKKEIAEKKKSDSIAFVERQEELEKIRKQNARTSTYNKLTQDSSVSYVYRLRNLGWSNIDRLYEDPRTRQVDFTAIADNQDEFDIIYVSLVFKYKNIYLPGYRNPKNTFSFTHSEKEKIKLPVGEDAIIVATAYKDDKPFLGIKDCEIKEKGMVSFSLTETTLEKMTEIIKEKI